MCHRANDAILAHPRGEFIHPLQFGRGVPAKDRSLGQCQQCFYLLHIGKSQYAGVLRAAASLVGTEEVGALQMHAGGQLGKCAVLRKIQERPQESAKRIVTRRHGGGIKQRSSVIKMGAHNGLKCLGSGVHKVGSSAAVNVQVDKARQQIIARGVQDLVGGSLAVTVSDAQDLAIPDPKIGMGQYRRGGDHGGVLNLQNIHIEKLLSGCLSFIHCITGSMVLEWKKGFFFVRNDPLQSFFSVPGSLPSLCRNLLGETPQIFLKVLLKW